MSGTNTIYSQIIDVSTMDNIGLEVNYTGTPTGTFTVNGSISGLNFYALTFTPSLTQPAGSAGGYLVNISVYALKYFLLEYTNSSGTGVLTVYGQQKDVN